MVDRNIPPGDSLSQENRYGGLHLGNIMFFSQDLTEQVSDVKEQLKDIRDKDISKKEQFKRERNALLEFKETVGKRSGQISEKADKIRKHLPDEMTDYAEDVKNSKEFAREEPDKEEYDLSFNKGNEVEDE